MDIVLPMCLEVNLYFPEKEFVETVGNTIGLLAKMRPQLIFPKLMKSIEEGIPKPNMPLRLTQPLLALGNSIDCLLAPQRNFNKYPLGQQPTDQVHNFPLPEVSSGSFLLYNALCAVALMQNFFLPGKNYRLERKVKGKRNNGSLIYRL